MQRWICFAAGLVLAIAGGLGTAYSIRAGRAQAGYYANKYGHLSDADNTIVGKACSDLVSLYPHNYYLCIQGVSRLWPKGPGAQDSDFEEAAMWCARGLELNPHHRILRRARTQLIARESPGDAADYWSEFVDWQFWNARNQAFLVECLAKAGRLVEAAERLSLIEDREGYDRAAAALRRAWAAEMQR